MELKFDGREIARARDKWLHGEGSGCCDPISLGASSLAREFLTNRLARAFEAGIHAAEQIVKEATESPQRP